jgi:hypothetical protein
MSWLLGLAGIGGGLGLIGVIVSGLWPALIPAGLKLLDKIPAKVVYALAGVLLIALAWLWHGHAVKVAYRDGNAAGETATDAKWTVQLAAAHSQADQWRRSYDLAAGELVVQIKAKHDETLRNNLADADALRVRGPGKAALDCARPGNTPRLSSAAGRPGDPAPDPDAPRLEVPSDNGYAVVPWPWLVDRAREHDDAIAKVAAYRERDAKVRTLYESAVAKLVTPGP